MNSRNLAVYIFANAPECLSELCGVSLIERLLRVLQRLGVTDATIVTDSPEIVAELSRPSWARAEIVLAFLKHRDDITIGEFLPAGGDKRFLIVRGDFYYDARLLRALARATKSSVLIDSNPSGESWPIAEIPAAACIANEDLRRGDHQLSVWGAVGEAAGTGQLALLDAAEQPPYVASMRREFRPIFFRAPIADHRQVGESFILNAAQNGTLDLPAMMHAPVETAIVSRLCWTSITPNQVTFITLIVGLITTFLFASGYLWWGAILALLIGVLDGVDGKLARVKEETTELGGWEHSLDYVVELSWWIALASWFHRSGELPTAYRWLLLLFTADLLGRLAKRSVKLRLHRNLDDVSAFDRVVRYVAGRRNIYVWIFAIGLLLGYAASAFAGLCAWGGLSAAIHAIRAMQIRFAPKSLPPAPPLAQD